MAPKNQAAKADDKAVAVVETAGLPAIAQNYGLLNPELAVVIRENAGAGGLSATDLVRIKMPGAGGLSFEIPTLEGKPEIVQEITCIILAWNDQRVYWSKEFNGASSSTPPDCASLDCIVGTGVPGGSCAACPMSQWGSYPKDGSNAQACKQVRPLFFIRKDKGALPMRIVAPPTSVGDIKKFFLNMASASIPYYGAEVVIGLTRDKSKSGVDYSKITLKVARKLEPEEFKIVAALVASMKGKLMNMTIDQDEVAGTGTTE